MALPTDPEYWMRLAMSEPDDAIIGAGVPTHADLLLQIQMLAAIGIEETDDKGPLADLFAEIHRTVVSGLVSNEPPCNEQGHPTND